MANIQWQEGGGRFKLNNGLELEYECYGPSPQEAFTLVLLHEGLGSVSLWKEFPKKLADETGLGVFVYSRAGYGQSDAGDLPWPIDYMSQEAHKTLPQIIDAIDAKQIVLVGHSDGASIAAIYAGGVEDHRVRGLVMLAPHFFTEPMGLASIEKAKEAFEQGDLKSGLARHHKDPDHCFTGWNDSWLHPEFKEWNIADSIDHFRIPVLAIQGQDDQYGTLAQIEEIKARIYAPAEFGILENCKHSPHLDQPEKTLNLIADYLDRLQSIEKTEVKVA